MERKHTMIPTSDDKSKAVAQVAHTEDDESIKKLREVVAQLKQESQPTNHTVDFGGRGPLGC